MIKIKKLKQIEETEKRTDNILQNNKFLKWFNGSKVVDSDGFPLVCFHGTNSVFNNFQTLSHFGSAETSNDIIKNSENSSIVPVYLSIKNPLEIEDFGRNSNLLGIDIWQIGKISNEELKQIYSKDTIRELSKLIKNNKLKDFIEIKNAKINRSKLISILKQKGYDGLKYKNDLEGDNEISWVIFNANQVWPIFSNKPDKKSKEINEIEIFHDEGNETEKEKLYYIKKAIQNKSLPEKEYNGYIFKIWKDSDTVDYIMMKDEKLIGVFSFEIINNFNAISYRWLSSEYRGKGLYEVFLQFLKTQMNIPSIISDQLMTKGAIASTLKLQNKHKVEFINIDTKETFPINDETLKKYITDDYDNETFPWRFLIII